MAIVYTSWDICNVLFTSRFGRHLSLPTTPHVGCSRSAVASCAVALRDRVAWSRKHGNSRWNLETRFYNVHRLRFILLKLWSHPLVFLTHAYLLFYIDIRIASVENSLTEVWGCCCKFAYSYSISEDAWLSCNNNSGFELSCWLNRGH